MTEITRESLMAGIFGDSNSATIEEIDSLKEAKSFKVYDIPIEELHVSPKNMFEVKYDEDLVELTASIKDKGVLQPILVRPSPEGGYEIIAGERRRMGAIKANQSSIPGIIRDISDDDRDIIIGDTNLHRPHISISEKARAIRMKYDAMKRKAGRKKDLEKLGEPSSPISKTADILAKKMGLSDRTIQKYVRLTYLIPDILENLIDSEQLTQKAGVQISYLSEDIQNCIYKIIQSENIRISEESAEQLRKAFEGRTDAPTEEMKSFFFPEGTKVKAPAKKSGVKLNKSIKRKYFPKEYDDEMISQIITEFLNAWAAEHNPDYEEVQGEQCNE